MKKLIASLTAAVALVQSAACVAIEKPQPTGQTAGGVRVKGSLSQTKVLQGSDGLIYLQVDMDAPEKRWDVSSLRKPTDFVIVLDRSGSMADERKMDYAHRAIDSLINQLQPTDRFGLVAFDSEIETPITLTHASYGNKSRFRQIVRGIGARGGTNLGGGLLQGIAQIQSAVNFARDPMNRAQRMILISDGLANEGITDETELRRIAGNAASKDSSNNTFSISTIGVGIDFNEHLMAGVADYGHGNYYYLEKLAQLDKVLADEFHRASQIAASDVRVELELGDGITMTDASGYPYRQEGRRLTVEPGHLYGGQKKSFFITIQVPTHTPFMRPLGTVDVVFRTLEKGDQPYRVNLVSPEVTIACLPAEKKQEVLSSMDKKVYEKAWTENNYGHYLRENAAKVGAGDQAGAIESIHNYRDRLQQAYEAAPTPGMKQKLEALKPQEAEVRGAFSAPDATTATKRLGKGLQYEGIQNQRNSP